MLDNGFNVNIWTDMETGFIHGGNKDNCGTWMDKMGSAAGVNKGVPATPRDGAAIEIVGLQYSVLSYLGTLYEKGIYKKQGVTQMHFSDWAFKISSNFEARFFINRN
jgi:glycogen debranching enzyme